MEHDNAEAGQPAPTRTAAGKPPGLRGEATRKRLIDCTAQVVATKPYRDLSVATITRLAGTSPATFYRYFKDVDESLMILAEDMLRGADDLKELVGDQPWTHDARRRSTDLVEGFFAFWEHHRNVIRVIEFLADDGERQFERVRARLLRGLTTALGEIIAGTRRSLGADHVPNARALAVGLVAMMAQAARYGYAFEHWDIARIEVHDALIEIVADTVRGSPAGEAG